MDQYRKSFSTSANQTDASHTNEGSSLTLRVIDLSISIQRRW